jgi:hypothetical protein
MGTATEPAMPQPTQEHQKIQAMAGRWNVKCTFYMDPSAPPMECDAIETFEQVGPFWVVSKYEADFMGAPFVGRCTMGYDPHRKLWTSTWIDCMSPSLFSFTGNMKGDTLVMEGDAWSCMTNQVARHRTTNKAAGKDEWVMEMFQTMPDGKEVKTMRAHYRRA